MALPAHYAYLVTVADGAGDGKPVRPPYEQARDELIELVKRLEAGGLTLGQSLRLWERGEDLAAICEEWLEGARARLATALRGRGPARWRVFRAPERCRGPESSR